MHDWWDGGVGWGFGLVGLIMMVLFWGAVIVGIVLVVRALTQQSAPRSGQETGVSAPARPRALDLLEERYARGEIDREEFLERREDLGGGSGPPRV
ncbi:MAG TPA: SHOCT domain-containing protein [Thermoleophilia bacterium]|nr:SHOCT domain-containing protein [Thermoleophilia bacterium]